MNNTNRLETELQGKTEDASQYLTFLLEGEEYGIDILKVNEIRGWEKPTLLPKTVNYVLGVINLRGTVVPIVDLRVRFGMESANYGKKTVVIVVKAVQSDKERTIGMVVDSVSEVYRFSDDMIRPAADLGGNISAEFITGLATVDKKMIILLNVDDLINRGVLNQISES